MVAFFQDYVDNNDRVRSEVTNYLQPQKDMITTCHPTLAMSSDVRQCFTIYLGAGRHLRPEENSKNRKIEKKILPLHQKPALLKSVSSDLTRRAKIDR